MSLLRCAAEVNLSLLIIVIGVESGNERVLVFKASFSEGTS